MALSLHHLLIGVLLAVFVAWLAVQPSTDQSMQGGSESGTFATVSALVSARCDGINSTTSSPLSLLRAWTCDFTMHNVPNATMISSLVSALLQLSVSDAWSLVTLIGLALLFFAASDLAAMLSKSIDSGSAGYLIWVPCWDVAVAASANGATVLSSRKLLVSQLKTCVNALCRTRSGDRLLAHDVSDDMDDADHGLTLAQRPGLLRHSARISGLLSASSRIGAMIRLPLLLILVASALYFWIVFLPVLAGVMLLRDVGRLLQPPVIPAFWRVSVLVYSSALAASAALYLTNVSLGVLGSSVLMVRICLGVFRFLSGVI